MDVAGTSSILAQQSLNSEVSVKLAGMAKDQMEQQGKDMLKLLDSTEVKQAKHPSKGHNLDVSG
ncbi:MAG: YjfB family protein [Bacillota bacterium]